MTRKDYVAIAEAVQVSLMSPAIYGDVDEVHTHNDGIVVVARNIADVMQADNPRFDRNRFLKACGAA